MKVFIPENEPYEIIDSHAYPLGYKLIEFLPQIDEKIKDGEHKDEVHIEFNSITERTNETAAEIIERVKKSIAKNKNSRAVDAREITFGIALCEYISLCNEDIRFYTENNFLKIMAIYGFQSPRKTIIPFDAETKRQVISIGILPSNLFSQSEVQRKIRGIPYKDKEDTGCIFAWEYDCNCSSSNYVEYYYAVMLELVKHNKFVKQCAHCGRWFVTNNRTDEKYCKRESPYRKGRTCPEAEADIRNYLRNKKTPLAQERERARNRSNQLEGVKEEYKRLDAEYQIAVKNDEVETKEQEWIEKFMKCARGRKRGKKQ